MFTIDDYEDEIIEKLNEYFETRGETISEETVEDLAEEIHKLINSIE
jgi:hypothetical protein